MIWTVSNSGACDCRLRWHPLTLWRWLATRDARKLETSGQRSQWSPGPLCYVFKSPRGHSGQLTGSRWSTRKDTATGSWLSVDVVKIWRHTYTADAHHWLLAMMCAGAVTRKSCGVGFWYSIECCRHLFDRKRRRCYYINNQHPSPSKEHFRFHMVPICA